MKYMNYVAYYRVSTKQQSLGLLAQQNMVSEYIKNVNGVLVATFEEKESGKNNDRVELKKAIEVCKKNGSTLLIAKLDRLSRNISFIFSLRDAKVNFCCCDIQTCNTLTLGLFATLAQYERETISLRTKQALAAKKNDGYKLGAPHATFTDDMRLKAIKVNKNKANNNINNRRAYIIIKSLSSENMSLRSMAKYLNENGFRTSKDTLFTATSVSRLIKRYNKEEL